MTLPVASNPISMSQVSSELGFSSNSQKSLNDSDVRNLLGKPTNLSTISLSDGWGKSNRTPLSITLAGDTAAVVIQPSLFPGYVAGKSDVTVTINSGVFIYSNAIGVLALDVNGFTAGDTVHIVNYGYIVGHGGNGGSGSGNSWKTGRPGTSGGPALRAQFTIIVSNYGVIGGGGGGGGGGGWCNDGLQDTATNGAGGGGGGGGRYNGSWGPQSESGARHGQNGTDTTGGLGGAQYAFTTDNYDADGNYISTTAYINGAGGPGGNLGNPGADGSPGKRDGVVQYAGGAGGPAGAAIINNGNITWLNVGTIYGPIQ